MVLLYLDVLGMKSRWESGGVVAAKAAYRTFDLVIRHALEAVDSGVSQSATGGIQSDAGSFVLPNVSSGIVLGTAIFREAFRRSGTPVIGRERFWLRGAIIEIEDDELEATEQFHENFPNVKKRVFSDDLLNAINVEQSGYRGQRLLVQESLVTEQVNDEFKIPVGNRDFMPLASLAFAQPVEGFRDVLWMFPTQEAKLDEEWDLMKIAMQNRLRWSGRGGPAEFTQAAATQLVFAECQAIYSDLLEGQS